MTSASRQNAPTNVPNGENGLRDDSRLHGVQKIRDVMAAATNCGLLWEAKAPHGARKVYGLSLWSDRRTMVFSVEHRNPHAVAQLAGEFVADWSGAA